MALITIVDFEKLAKDYLNSQRVNITTKHYTYHQEDGGWFDKSNAKDFLNRSESENILLYALRMDIIFRSTSSIPAHELSIKLDSVEVGILKHEGQEGKMMYSLEGLLFTNFEQYTGYNHSVNLICYKAEIF